MSEGWTTSTVKDLYNNKTCRIWLTWWKTLQKINQCKFTDPKFVRWVDDGWIYRQGNID